MPACYAGRPGRFTSGGTGDVAADLLGPPFSANSASSLPERCVRPRLPVVRRDLLPDSHRLSEIRSVRHSLEEQVHVVRHDAVRNNFEVAREEERWNVRGDSTRGCRVSEERRAVSGDDGSQIPMAAQVIERLYSRRTTWPHAGGTATSEPGGPNRSAATSAGSYIPGATSSPAGFSTRAMRTENVNVDPVPGVLTTEIEPPISATSRAQMVSPRPVPP